MKKLFTQILTLIILVIVVINSAACSKIDNNDINQNILETITEIQMNTYKLNNLMITFDEYNQKTEKYISKYFTSFYKSGYIIYADDTFVFSITGKHYEEKDWKGMKLSELKKIGEPLSQSLALSKPGYFYTSFDVSKVYDDNSSSDTSQHYKNIFIRMTDSYGVTHYKQYRFKREGQNYVLFSFSGVLVDVNKEFKYGNNEVEFSGTINLSDN